MTIFLSLDNENYFFTLEAITSYDNDRSYTVLKDKNTRVKITDKSTSASELISGRESRQYPEARTVLDFLSFQIFEGIILNFTMGKF